VPRYWCISVSICFRYLIISIYILVTNNRLLKYVTTFWEPFFLRFLSFCFWFLDTNNTYLKLGCVTEVFKLSPLTSRDHGHVNKARTLCFARIRPRKGWFFVCFGTKRVPKIITCGFIRNAGVSYFCTQLFAAFASLRLFVALAA